MPQRSPYSCVFLIGLIVAGCTSEPPRPSKPPTPQRQQTSTPTSKVEKPIKKSQQKMVLVTIDDLPVAMRGLYTKAQGIEIAKALCATLTKHNVPTLGFVNMKWGKVDTEALEIWRSCGVVTLGNHTWSHPHMRKIGVKAYLDDLEKGHNALRAIVPKDQTIYYRFPYLYEGHDPANQLAVRQKLKSLKSPNVPVTLDTSDWYYARGYARALKKKDAAAAQRFQQSWLWDLKETTEQAEWLAQSLFQRQPPQVLLLHANLLNARHLEAYILWLKARGYQFVTVEKVLNDPAFKLTTMSTSPRGRSHWIHVRRHREMQKSLQPNK